MRSAEVSHRDGHGCHSDRRAGGYHCHTGEYGGLKFTSKTEMLTYKKKGVSAAQIRTERHGPTAVNSGYPISPDNEDGWQKWIPFGKRKNDAATAKADVIVPRGIQERLRVLKDLHQQGLITDEDYESKRKEILGEL